VNIIDVFMQNIVNNLGFWAFAATEFDVIFSGCQPC